MKNKKSGMSVISLVSAVAIILILLSTVTVSGINTANNAKKIAFGSEIKMIQGAVDAYYTKNNASYPIKNNAYELNFENASSKNKKIFQDNEGEDKTAFTTYEIDCEELGITELTYGKNKEENDVYVLSRNSGKVYYLKGLEIGGQTYYTVTDDIENLLSYNSEKNTVNSPVIKFVPSTTDWTNESIEIKIEVPSTCTLSSVLFNNTQKTLTESKLTVTQNGTLTVKYVENIAPTEEKEAKYIVSSIDTKAPKVVIDTDELVQIASRGDLGYIKIKEKNDDLSGIKCLKYEYGDVTDIDTYFKTSGKDVKEDIIFFRELTEPITIYAEDNAGNKVVQKITPQGDIIKEEIDDDDDDEIPENALIWPVIPNGFSASNLEPTTEKIVLNGQTYYKAKGWDEGLVIANEIDQTNEFVWVPVEDFSKFKTTTTYNGTITTPTYYYEPYQYAGEEEKTEYNAMLESVKKYGGFYIGRYEASKSSSGKAQSTAYATPWNNIIWSPSMTNLTYSSGAVGAARAVYPVESATKEKDAVSTLCYGVQWDAAITFIAKKYPEVLTNCDGLGNANSSTIIETGSNYKYAQNNIYDMCGNVMEWTMEAWSSNNVTRALRGGHRELKSPSITYRTNDYIDGSNGVSDSIGFRLALYIL